MRRVGLCALVVLLLAAAACAPGQAVAGARVALVIGNSTYEKAPLANPANDAKAVADALKSMKFDTVILKRDLTGEGMRSALAEIGRAAAGADIAVLYFAGHGVEISGRNYLLPIDAKLARAGDVELEAVNLETVIQQLDGATQLKLVFLDACRNNPFQPAGGKRSLPRGLARVEPEDNTLVAYAAKEGTTADDGVGQKNSPFTTALLRHLATPDLEIRLMLGRVRDEVIASTGDQQRPHIYGTLGGSAISLAPASGAASPPPASAAVDADLLKRLKDSEEAKRRLEAQVAEEAKRRSDAEKVAQEAKKLEDMRAELEAIRRRQGAEQAMLTPPQRPQPPASSPGSDRPRQAGERCDNRGALTVCASSILGSQFGNSYLPRNLLDGNTATAWVEGVSGDGRGQWVAFDFTSPRLVQQIVINNGYGKNRDIYGKNSRVRSGELLFSTGQRVPFELDDRADAQAIQLPQPITAKWVQLTVTAVYPGWKYQDLAISDIKIVGP